MSGEMSAAQALAKRQLKRGRGKKVLAAFGILLLAVIVVFAVIAIKRIRYNDEIQMAQSAISQFEINTTYREQELDPEGDEDGDGVLNRHEKQNSTNPLDEDTDNDGLSDGSEIELGTDPNNSDTDGDGLLDGYEVVLGLDPQATSTDGKTDDGERILEYTKKYGDLTLKMKGDANIADVSIYEMSIFNISSNTGTVGKSYDLMSSYPFESASLTIKVSKSELESRGLKLSELSVLKFDKSKMTYEKLSTTADSAKSTVTAEISDYGTYVVGVEKKANKAPSTRIAFLLDNSGSMYPEDVSNYPSENDVEFKRLDFAKSLVKKIGGEGDYKYSVAKFTGNYTLLQDFTSKPKKFNKALDRIKDEDETFDGSHIETALELCMDSFSGSDKTYRNIIVLLSDGASDEKGAKTVEQLADIAADKNIIVMTIGLGNEADRNWLQKVSKQTGGRYYSASDADALEAVYEQIVTTLNYDVVSYIDAETAATGYSLYNTGFIPDKNGFSFKNFRTSDTPSVDFGMALMARDWYVGRLSMKQGKFSPEDESGQKYDAPGYNLKGSKIEEKFKSNEPLSSVVPEMLTSELADVKQYLDYTTSGGTLSLKSRYTARAIRQGWVTQKYKLDADNLKWDKVELLSLDISKSADKIAKASSDEEAEFYKALYSLNAVQWDDAYAEFDLYGSDGDDGFDLLKELLARGEPVLTTIDGTHTVNAIGLIQDSDDHRKFVVQIYDSNYPGSVRQLYVTRSVKGDITVKDGKATCDGVSYEYTCEYEGKQVGVKFSDVAI